MSKRLLQLLALLLALGLFAAACGDDDESTDTADADDSASESDDDMADDANDLGGREITIAVENAYLPFNYLDPETGEPTGWDYEVIDAMCGILNCTPVYQEYPWEPMIQAVADGQFDMAADGITITEERGEVVAFSDGYIDIEQRMLVRLGEDRFASADRYHQLRHRRRARR